jgi:hypothetical protein
MMRKSVPSAQERQANSSWRGAAYCAYLASVDLIRVTSRAPSTNNKLVAGYSRQLETYKGAEETTRGFYVVLDVGGMGQKDQQLIALKNRMAGDGHPVSPIIFIDGARRPSASKLK